MLEDWYRVSAVEVLILVGVKATHIVIDFLVLITSWKIDIDWQPIRTHAMSSIGTIRLPLCAHTSIVWPFSHLGRHLVVVRCTPVFTISAHLSHIRSWTWPGTDILTLVLDINEDILDSVHFLFEELILSF